MESEAGYTLVHFQEKIVGCNYLTVALNKGSDIQELSSTRRTTISMACSDYVEAIGASLKTLAFRKTLPFPSPDGASFELAIEEITGVSFHEFGIPIVLPIIQLASNPWRNSGYMGVTIALSDVRYIRERLIQELQHEASTSFIKKAFLRSAGFSQDS